ncbi:MAG: M3 family metallopeptidase [Bacillota bacterium]|nr:M3 family metallopeptidase [Bacillota bacterium]
MLRDLPLSFREAMDWGWAEFEPYARTLLDRQLSPSNLSEWMSDESRLLALIHELNGRLAVAVDRNHANGATKDRLSRFRKQVWARTRHLMNQLERKLIDSNLVPPDYDIQLKCIRNNLEIHHPDNVDLEAEEKDLRDQYEAVRGRLRIEVGDRSYSAFDVLRMLRIEPDRARREPLYRRILTARTAVKEEYDAIWERLFALRQQIARNAGVSDYRAYMWKRLNRHDYTPYDVIAFCDAIENVIVPVVANLRRQQSAELGVDSAKPWDVTVEAQADQPLTPYRNTKEWLQRSRNVFQHISPLFGKHFDTMQAEGLLDLESRSDKSPWNYAEWLPASNRSFVFINGRGGNSDLFMLFHEFGHAVQMIEMSALPYLRQKMLPNEISEVASTTMELLASDNLTEFYAPEQAELARRNHLASMLARWPSVAMVALFQHWAYTNPEEGSDPEACDHYWLSLCNRFVPSVDYSGFEDDLRMQWREVFQVFVFPFYYIEYAFAQLGAVQIWQNYRRNPQGTIGRFRHALSRGYTVSIPEFYTLAGAEFGPHRETLQQAVEAI